MTLCLFRAHGVVQSPFTIALLFTQLFSVAFVPSEWKNAIITPVFKKGVASDVSNYRPISLTCVASKIMERVVATKIFNHLHCNNLLSCTQHGFVKGRSTGVGHFRYVSISVH